MVTWVKGLRQRNRPPRTSRLQLLPFIKDEVHFCFLCRISITSRSRSIQYSQKIFASFTTSKKFSFFFNITDFWTVEQFIFIFFHFLNSIYLEKIISTFLGPRPPRGIRVVTTDSTSLTLLVLNPVYGRGDVFNYFALSYRYVWVIHSFLDRVERHIFHVVFFFVEKLRHLFPPPKGYQFTTGPI